MRTMQPRLKQSLSRRDQRHIVDTSRVSSAVLVPIYHKQGQYYILLTKRTETVKDHKGQISFPGGAYEAEDRTLVNTALRECAEEIGLTADRIEVLGELDDTLTHTSNYIISPFVALIRWPYQFNIDQREIEEIIEVPIMALLERNCQREKTEILDGEAITSYFYHYQGKVIWGATAKILNQFLVIFTRVINLRPL